MIIDEIKVKTKKELDALFEKLHKEGFTWEGNKNILEHKYFVQFYNNVAYIHIHDNKIITWYSEHIPRCEWEKLA